MQITITTPRRSLKTRFRKKWKRNIPTTWQEMNTRQKIQAIIAFSIHSREEKIKALEAMLLSWLDLPNIVKQSLDPAHIYQMIELMDQIEIDNLPPASIIPDHEGYRALEAQLSNCTNLEYALADEFYNEFFNQANTENTLNTDTLQTSLHKLTAVIYAPVTEGNRKAHQTRAAVLDHAKITAQWPQHIHISTLYFFSQAKKMIHNTYGRWLFQPQEEEPDPSDTKPKQTDPFGWWGIYMDIAETGTFGTFNDVLQANLHNTLIYLVKKIQAQTKSTPIKK